MNNIIQKNTLYFISIQEAAIHSQILIILKERKTNAFDRIAIVDVIFDKKIIYFLNKIFYLEKRNYFVLFSKR